MQQSKLSRITHKTMFCKCRKKENDNEGLSVNGSRTVREPRVVVQTTGDIDILDDDGASMDRKL